MGATVGCNCAGITAAKEVEELVVFRQSVDEWEESCYGPCLINMRTGHVIALEQITYRDGQVSFHPSSWRSIQTHARIV